MANQDGTWPKWDWVKWKRMWKCADGKKIPLSERWQWEGCGKRKWQGNAWKKREKKQN